MNLIIPLAYSMPAEVFYLSHSARKKGRKEGRQAGKEPRLGTLSLKSLMRCMKPDSDVATLHLGHSPTASSTAQLACRKSVHSHAAVLQS